MAASRVQAEPRRRPSSWARAAVLLQLVVLALPALARGAADRVQIDERASSSTNLPPSAVPEHLVRSALDFLNEHADRDYGYKDGQLVGAQKLTKPPYVIYKLTLNLDPECSEEEKCSREVCTVDVRQHERGIVNVPQDSIHCRKLQMQSEQANIQEQKMIENLDKQIINQSTSLDHEVQISTDHNDRPFVAVKASQSDFCPGCPYELNPSLPGLSAFGDQVLQAMDEAGVGDYKHKLISIVRVTRAVPPGANIVQYQLLMEIGMSNCLRSLPIKISECPLQSNLPIRSCLVTFEEHPGHIGSRRITKNNCTDLLNTDNEVSASIDPNSLFSESISSKKEEDVSMKTEFYDQIAQEAQEVFRVPSMEISTKDSSEIATDSGIKELPDAKINLDEQKEKKESSKSSEKMKEFDEFLKDFDVPVKTETTSPKNLGIPVIEELIEPEKVEEKTSVETSKKPMEQMEDIKKEYQASFNPTVETTRSKRSVASKTSLDSKSSMRKLAIKAVELVDDRDDDNKKKHLIDLIDYTKERKDQRTNYYITVEVAPTDCAERDPSTECLDEVIPGPTEICKLDVALSDKESLESLKLSHFTCKNNQKSQKRSKRDVLLGGFRPLETNDPEVLDFLKLGLRHYSENVGGTNEFIASNVKEASYQIVAGKRYIIKADVGESTCAKRITDNCVLKSDAEVKECIFEILSQPWLDENKPKIKVECNKGNRRKRSLKGQNYSEKLLVQSRQFKEEKLFHQFMKAYNKSYINEIEKNLRFTIFKENLDMIEELQRNEQGTGRYGVTEFTDLTKAEFKARYLGLKPSLRSENDIPLPKAVIPDIELPLEYDWRHYNVVTPVKNQEQCGSCWAFSVTGNVEGQYAIKHGKLLSLSEQELVDCDKLDEGCNGGLPDSAYRALEELGGLETESDYPYDAKDEKCHFNQDKVKVRVISGLNITSDETKMAQWLVQNGPMSIGINANAMQFYIGGVSHPFHFLCDPNNLDHGVLIVGYGIKTYPIFKKKLPYWLIKNSWGPHWGEGGYYRIYRGDGSCGVNKMVTSAVVA